MPVVITSEYQIVCGLRSTRCRVNLHSGQGKGSGPEVS